MAGAFYIGGFIMKFKLQIFTQDNVEGNYVGRHYRFAVVDSDKSKSYPSNFICMLPSQISVDQKKNNVFSKMFGDQCEEQAKTLLTQPDKVQFMRKTFPAKANKTV